MKKGSVGTWAGLALAILLGAGFGLPAAAQDGTGRSVAFDHRTGNEWWVEVVLTGPDASTAARVEAQDEGGPWTALAKKSWGAWAGSFRIEPGHDVRFRAAWSDGDQAESCWFTHPAGVQQCPSPAPSSSTSTSTTSTNPPPAGSGLTFDHRGGNEWWVEVVLTGPDASTATRVEAQDEGGPWTELALKSWGAWAASFRLEAGHDVRFRAGGEGAWSESCWFTHPAGVTPTGGATCAGSTPSTTSTTSTSATGTSSGPSTFATFSGVKGNPYWVEVRVASTKPLAGVDASVDDGAWRALTLREWGAWAASFPVPDGSYLQFRATATDGATALSGDHVWPSARAVAPWPQAGSFVSYTLRTSGGAPDGSWWQTTDATLRLAYDGASWTGRCAGMTTTTDHTGASTTSAFDVAVTGLPARGPTDAAVGDDVDPLLLEGAGFGRCQHEQDVLTIEGLATHATSLRDAGGRTLSLRSWAGGEPADHSAYESDAATWDARLGLMLDWSHSARGGGLEGHLVDTDAPIR